MIVRCARASDAEAVERVRLAGWRQAYAGILDPAFLAARQVTPEMVRAREERLRSGVGVTLVAVDDAGVRAFAALLPCRDDDLDPATTTELAALYVDPACWSQGLGARLLDAGFARASAPLHVLWTLQGNTRARRFYERRGFVADGAQRELDLGGPVAEVRYRRAL